MQDTQNETFSNDPQENIRLENEILKLKMLAQFGDNMHMTVLNPVPAEVENSFLKNILAFHSCTESVRLYDFVGKPCFKPAAELTDEEISGELVYLTKVMHDKQVVLHQLGEYDHRTIYSFITEELFEQETHDALAPGMVRHFIYEDFHPNHRYDIENCVKQFLSDWFEQKFNEYSWELSDTFVFADRTLMSRDEVLSKIWSVFESYKYFTDEEFKITGINFELNDETETGVGHADGSVKYKAVLENNEVLSIEGDFRLYVSHEHGWWKVIYFVFPGFEWG